MMGPHMAKFLSICFQENRPLFTFVLGTSGIATLVTCLIAVRHGMALHKSPISLLRMYYIRISWFAPVFGGTAFVSLLCPRSYWLCKMVQLQFEALTISFFGTTMFILLAEESIQRCKVVEGPSQGIAHDILRALKAQGPRKHFAVPPFGCCFRPFIEPYDMKPRHLIWARYFFQQYTFVVVVGSMLVAYSALAIDTRSFMAIKHVVDITTKVSGFLAIYGLMILYVATHDLLEQWRTTAKFISIKLVVLLCTFQEWLIGWVSKHFDPVHCVDILNAGTIVDEKVKERHREHYMSMYMICLEAVVVSLLVYRAFSAAEVRQFEKETHLLLVQMELERRVEVGAEPSDSDDDSGGDEEQM